MSKDDGLPLPVGPIPAREDPTVREGRTAGLHIFAALAVGATLTKAARDSHLPWWWLNLPVVLVVGLAGSVAGLAAARAVDSLGERLDLGSRHRQARFWTRYFVAFLTDTLGFFLASEKLEGRSLWHGSPRWGWTVGWPLATLMIAANAIDVEAAERVAAARAMLLNPVTDLRNRRSFDADIAGLVRDRVSFTFVFADLDGLKQVNDAHGHAAGDAAVKSLGAALGRQVGVAYHWGGDEFVLLLPDTDRDTLLRVIQATFASVRALGVERNWPLGVSFGASFVRADETRSAEAIAASADQSLYAAKQAGRSRLVLSGEPPVVLS